MQFVHSLWPLEAVVPGTIAHPVLIAPLVGEIPDHRGGPWRHLAAEGEGVTLVYRVTLVLRYDVILVQSAGADATQESRPDTGGVVTRLEAIRLRIPTIEIADHGDSSRIRRPDSEVCALLTRHR